MIGLFGGLTGQRGQHGVDKANVHSPSLVVAAKTRLLPGRLESDLEIDEVVGHEHWLDALDVFQLQDMVQACEGLHYALHRERFNACHDVVEHHIQLFHAVLALVVLSDEGKDGSWRMNSGVLEFFELIVAATIDLDDFLDELIVLLDPLTLDEQVDLVVLGQGAFLFYLRFQLFDHLLVQLGALSLDVGAERIQKQNFFLSKLVQVAIAGVFREVNLRISGYIWLHCRIDFALCLF